MRIQRKDDINDSLAIYVKTHGMRFVDGGTEQQRERAWNRAMETWWQDADRAAMDCGYTGGADACGRSGGWCYPYDETVDDDHRGNGGRHIEYEDDEDAPRFLAFVERIEDLMQCAPDLYAHELLDVMTEDRDAETESNNAARLQEARDAMPAKLADALRGLMNYSGGWDTDASHPCGIARDVLAEFDALQAGTIPNYGANAQ